MTMASGASADGAAPRWPGLLALAAIVAGVIHAVLEFWVCDDAFISFRYAQNLIDGHGLVYNAGERVEGYTNFLWTLLVAAGMAAGADAVRFANVAGVVFFAATALLLLRVSCRIGTGAWFPVAAIGLAAHHHSAVFASCGLETAMFAFLLTALLTVLLEADRPGRFLCAGLLGVGASMTRPDGLLPYGVAGLYVLALACRHRRWSWFVAIALPGVAIYLPYFAWKWWYYGYPLPNTFYAKSAAQSYLSQGARYVGLYFQCYWVLAPALLAAVWLAFARLRRWDRFDAGTGGRAPLLIALLVVPYLAFVVWVGGDFMFTRFCLPITPALFLVGDLIRARLRTPGLSAALGIGVVVATLLPWYPAIVRAEGSPAGIVEEKDFYPPEKMAASRSIGEQLRAITAGTDVRVVIYGGQAVLAHYGAFPLVIEGSTGLTDAHIAHLPIEKRGRIGHEKYAPVQYLYERRVDLRLGWHMFEDPIGEQRIFDFGPMAGTFLIYRRSLVDALVARGARIRRFEDYLDGYLADLSSKPRDRLTLDYAWFKLYYFDHNEDPARQAAFEAALR